MLQEPAGQSTEWDDLPLDQDHVESLVSSSIPPENAELRGYETADAYTGERRLLELGFSKRVAKRAPGLIIPRRDVFGNRVYDQFRPDDPVRPDHQLVKYENKHGEPQGIDVPPGVELDQLSAPGEELWITEGRKKGDCLVAHGLVAIDVSGVWNWKGRNRTGGIVTLPDWHEIDLKGRNVNIVYDGDVQRKKEVRHALKELATWLNKKGAKVSCVWLPDTDQKTGVDDFLQDHTIEDLEQLLRPFDEKLDGDHKERIPSASTQLIHMARERYRLGVTEAEEPFGVPKSSHVAMMLRGGRAGLRAELARRYFDEHQTVAPQQALADTCLTLEGFASQTAPEKVHLRVAEGGDGVWIDMGDKAERVIHIYDGTWEIRNQAPVLFRRTKLTQPMPTPVTGGDISALWKFVPIDEDDRPLVLAFLVHALISVDTAHTILSLLAEHGSIKTTTTKFLVDLIDPSYPAVRKCPRSAEDWVTAANASLVVALDNVSGVVPQWLSDCLCRASTGDGDVRRQLYTDSDVSVISFRRVVIFNGVDVVVTQGDLADRLLRVRLPRVKKNYLKDADVHQKWAEAHPGILGGLLDLAAEVHKRMPDIKVNNSPRMADFAAVLSAIDDVNGTKGLRRYREQARRIYADTLDHPFIAALIAAGRDFADMTSAELLLSVTPDDKTWRAPKEWPKRAQDTTAQLTRYAPALRGQGWTVDDDDARNHDKVRRWTITRPEKVRKTSPQSPHPRKEGYIPSSEGAQGCGDECGDDGEEDQNRPRSDEREGSSAGEVSPQVPASPQNAPPLTRECGDAVDAGTKYGPSLVDRHHPPRTQGTIPAGDFNALRATLLDELPQQTR